MRPRPTFFVAAALAATVGVNAAFAQPFPAQGVDLLSNVTLTQFGVTGGNGNDVWGYVSPGGREYAIMGLSNRVSFVDVTVPTAPVIVTSVAHTNSLWAGIKVYGRYCYVSNEAGGGIQVIDMNNIDQGSVTLVRSITVNGLATAHTLAVDEVSGFLYLAGSNYGGLSGSIVAFSLADPSNPIFAGRWVGPYTHETQVVTYTTGPNAGRQIAFCYNGGSNFAIVDVTNKASMVTLAAVTYPGQQYCHQGWLSDDRQFVYLNDELDGPAQGVPYPLTRVFDVSNLNAPVLVNSFTGANTAAIDHNLYVKNGLIYESNYTSGLRVFDTSSSPTAPQEIAWIDTHPENDDPQYEGTWSNYPYLPSGTILISDINRGLFVVRLNLSYLTVSIEGGPLAILPVGRAQPIVARVTPLNASVASNGVVLHYRVNSGSWASATMTPLGGDLYRAALPASACNDHVDYYVAATTTDSRVFSAPILGQAAPFGADAYSGETTILLDTFEVPSGWQGGIAGDTATLGQWERGDPEVTTAQPNDDHSDAPGVNCWVTGRLAGTGAGSFDVDNGFTTLLSPSFNLITAPPGTRMGYWRWYSNSLGGAPNADVFTVQISNNDGATWSPVETVGPAGAGTSGGWIFHDFRVSDAITPTGAMRLRFIADDAGAGSLVEAALDDFSISTRQCTPPCPADLDDGSGLGRLDGGVDISDLLYFLALFDLGDTLADIDDGSGTGTPDGGVDISDLLYYLARFDAGC